MQIKCFQTKEELYDSVSKYYITRIKNNPKIVLGLATGSTPIPLYKNLIKDHQENKTDYSSVITYNLDEYLDIDINHPESYHSFMNKNLFSMININKENINIPFNDINEYQTKLTQNIIDIQLLGIGSNGHIGFNEPGTPFNSTTHIIELAKQTRLDNQRFFASLDEVPTHAITMGIKDIMNAKKIVVIATGENKAKAVFKMLKGDINTDLPASILQKHPDVTVYLDKEAAKLINESCEINN